MELLASRLQAPRGPQVPLLGWQVWQPEPQAQQPQGLQQLERSVPLAQPQLGSRLPAQQVLRPQKPLPQVRQERP